MTETNHKFYKSPHNTAVFLLALIAIIFVILLSINIIKGKDSNNASYPKLEFLISGEVLNDINLKYMMDNIEIHEIKFNDPMYEKEKIYKAFLLTDVLQIGFGDQWQSLQFSDVAFEALDGYTAVSSTSKLSEAGGYLVFQDLDFKDWEPIGTQGANPGPFYIVWTGPDQTTANEYPWPWQLSSLNLVDFQKQFASAIPVGALEDSNVYRGYEIFKGRCIRCHAMNGEGGKIGPDLNAPQSITTYRNTYMIKEFIRNPSKYRYTHMPDHPDLSEQNLDDILSYFKYMDEIRN